MFCKECGEQLKDDAVFCRNCGWKISRDISSSKKNVSEKPITSLPIASVLASLSSLQSSIAGTRNGNKKPYWLFGLIAAIIIAVGGLAFVFMNGSDGEFIMAVKTCTLPDTTESIEYVFDEFYGNQNWTVEKSTNNDKNHRYVVMNGQCYDRVDIMKKPELIDIEWMFDVNKITDDRYEISLRSGSINGNHLSDDEFELLLGYTYLNYIDDIEIYEEDLYEAKYLSYYSDENILNIMQNQDMIIETDIVNEISTEKATFAETTEASTVSSEATLAPQTYDYLSGDYIIGESNYTGIQFKEVSGMTEWEARLALNEIYARHGRLFNNQEIQAYFNSKSWYNGVVAPDDFDERVFNEYEKANIATLQEYIDSLKVSGENMFPMDWWLNNEYMGYDANGQRIQLYVSNGAVMFRVDDFDYVALNNYSVEDATRTITTDYGDTGFKIIWSNKDVAVLYMTTVGEKSESVKLSRIQ